jgi:hypothetical protein
MSESDTALYDEEVFGDKLPDAALEVAGSKCWDSFAWRTHTPAQLKKLIVSLV